MHPREVKQYGVYWWQATSDVRILVRVVSANERYYALRILTATPGEVLRIGYGVGETAQVLTNPNTLEKVS